VTYVPRCHCARKAATVAKATGGLGGPLDLPNMLAGALCHPCAPQKWPMPQPLRLSHTSVVLEPPFIMASAAGSFGCHFDPTVVVAMVRGGFFPP
jgi:hypothetical protein